LLKGVHLTLLVGPGVPVPAPREVVDALTEARVTESTSGASGFQLTFKLDQASPLNTLFVAATATAPMVRVILVATVNGIPHVLMDGVATRAEVATENEEATCTVTGEDLSRVMDAVDLSGLLVYPAMTLQARALACIARYAPFGLVPVVIPEIIPMVDSPTTRYPSHRGTDLAYLREMASQAGYVFYVEPGPAPGASIAYWGPEVRVGPPAPTLTAGMGAHANVQSLSFAVDGGRATLPLMWIYEENSKVPFLIPVPPVSLLYPPLGAVPPVPKRTEFLETGHVSPARAALIGLARSASSSDALTGNGALDVQRYGWVLRPRRLVGVRGAGAAFDGLWYVSQVTHEIKRGSYRQTFSLVRNGVFSTVPRLPP
jgi:hypothetical protein